MHKYTTRSKKTKTYRKAHQIFCRPINKPEERSPTAQRAMLWVCGEHMACAGLLSGPSSHAMYARLRYTRASISAAAVSRTEPIGADSRAGSIHGWRWGDLQKAAGF